MVQDLWSHWKLTYNKVYANDAEESHKFSTFKDNYLYILNWNADPTQTSTVGLN